MLQTIKQLLPVSIAAAF